MKRGTGSFVSSSSKSRRNNKRSKDTTKKRGALPPSNVYIKQEAVSTPNNNYNDEDSIELIGVKQPSPPQPSSENEVVDLAWNSPNEEVKKEKKEEKQEGSAVRNMTLTQMGFETIPKSTVSNCMRVFFNELIYSYSPCYCSYCIQLLKGNIN